MDEDEIICIVMAGEKCPNGWGRNDAIVSGER